MLIGYLGCESKRVPLDLLKECVFNRLKVEAVKLGKKDL